MSGEWLTLDLPEAREAAMRELGLWSRFYRRIGEQEKTAGADDDGRAWLRKPRHIRAWAGMGNGPSFQAELSQIEEQADAELMRKYQCWEWEMWVAPASDPLAMKKVNPAVSLSGSTFHCDDPRKMAIGPVDYWVQFRQPAPIERSDPPTTSEPSLRPEIEGDVPAKLQTTPDPKEFVTAYYTRPVYSDRGLLRARDDAGLRDEPGFQRKELLRLKPKDLQKNKGGRGSKG
jgi:hypothetical protein